MAPAVFHKGACDGFSFTEADKDWSTKNELKNRLWQGHVMAAPRASFFVMLLVSPIIPVLCGIDYSYNTVCLYMLLQCRARCIILMEHY